MALEYYLYSYSCHFSSSNIFGYSFIDFWKTEYIWILVWKLFFKKICSNICFELYSNICLSMFNELCHSLWESGSNLCIKYTLSVKNQVEDSINELFFKVTTLSHEYEYLNIQIKWPSNIICIHIYAISRVRISWDIHSVNTRHPNIFGYSFVKLCGIRIYSDICSGPFWDIHSSLPHL